MISGVKWVAVVLICLVPSFPVHAHVYKWVDDAGNVYYGDAYPEGVHPYMVIIPPQPTLNPNDMQRHRSIQDYLQQLKEKSRVSGALYYERIEITSPSDGFTIRSNTGDFDVVVDIFPGLNVDAGHQALLTIDGRAVTRPQINPRFHLTNIYRGAHTLMAYVVSRDGSVILESRPVTVYIMSYTSEGPGAIPEGVKQPEPGQPKPMQVQPKPLQAQPRPMWVQPKPGQVQPAPMQSQPSPTQSQPVPMQVQPGPLPAQPSPMPVQPKPLPVQPKPMPVQPRPK
jgi:hypothetical protein